MFSGLSPHLIVIVIKFHNHQTNILIGVGLEEVGEQDPGGERIGNIV